MSISIIILLVLLLFGFKIIDKSRELNIENILNKGSLMNSTKLRGEIFYKGVTKNTKDKLSYFVYIRLEDGKELVVENFKFYSDVKIGDIVNTKKETHIHKAQSLSFYSILHEEFKENRFYEELDFIY